MIFFEALLMGFVLSADSFTAALAMGFRSHTRRFAIGFALTSSLLEGLVTLLGVWGGKEIVKRFADYDHWVAFLMLGGVALHMVFESLSTLRQKEATPSSPAKNTHSVLRLMVVSLATSFDGLGVGMGWGILSKPWGYFIVFTVFWAFFGTLMGLYLARHLSLRFGARLNLLGALILAILAIKLLEI